MCFIHPSWTVPQSITSVSLRDTVTVRAPKILFCAIDRNTIRKKIILHKVNCTEKYFKCPISYCIPERHRCNGLWNCPGGVDEAHCSNRTCPGKFKCHNSSICIALASICDDMKDCPYYDDGTFCTLPPCPLHKLRRFTD